MSRLVPGYKGENQRNSYAKVALEADRDHNVNREELTLVCPMCQAPNIAWNKMKYDGEFGGRICMNCYHDKRKKPCKECFLVHEGECF